MIQYWNLREELTIQNDLVLKGGLVVIRPTLRPEVLNIIHQRRLEKKRCILRARTSVLWPVITNSKEIVNRVDQCRPSQKSQKKKQKEPILQIKGQIYLWLITD